MANLSSKTGTVTTPVQAQISLANNAATSVQDMSAYQAQEVTGFVYVDASSDLRCSFKVMVVKNGAGTYEVASTDLSGDNFSSAPMVSFSMSGSILQATLPNVTDFASAYLRYQLSAPYLGGNYPLTVSARQVAGDVSGVTVPAGYIGEQLSASISAVTLSVTDTSYNAASLSLTPGVWLVYGKLYVGVAGTTQTYVEGSINTTSATSHLPTLTRDTSAGVTLTRFINIAPRYVNISSTTTYYLVVASGFTGTAPATIASGTTFYAVRIA